MKSRSNEGDTTNYAERATAAAHDAVDRAGERAAHAEERLRETADEVGRRGREARDRAQAWGHETSDTARSYIDEHPLASLAIAFGAGVVLASLMRR